MVALNAEGPTCFDFAIQHGVPGAFMSIIGYDLIKNIVEIQGEECPELILNRLNQEVVDTFNRNNTSSQEDSYNFV